MKRSRINAGEFVHDHIFFPVNLLSLTPPCPLHPTQKQTLALFSDMFGTFRSETLQHDRWGQEAGLLQQI